jgi:hypothetical protein
MYSKEKKHKQSCPATRHRGAKGERRYSFYSFLSLALDRVSGQRHAPTTIHPGKGPPVAIGYEAVWTSELVWTPKLWENPLPLLGN